MTTETQNQETTTGQDAQRPVELIVMCDYYDIPESVKELFANGESSYSITDPYQSGDNIFAMNLFLECVGVPDEMIVIDDGTQVTLKNGDKRIVIDSGGLGDFHLHGFDVTVLDT